MLKCKVNTKEFQDTITKLDVIIPNKSSLKVLECIKLTVTENSMQFTATDLENYVVAKINDFETESQGSVLITNIKEIIKSFKFMKEAYTTIDVNQDTITLSNSNRNIKMRVSADDYPNEFEIADIHNKYTYNTKSLHNRISKIDYARSKDNSRPLFTGIHFNSIDIVAVDGYRMALNKDNTLMIEKPFTLAQGTVNFLNKTFDKKVEKELRIAVNDKHIVFEYDNLIVKSRLLEGRFFNYKDILPKEYNSLAIDTKKLKENVEFLSIYTKDIPYNLVKMHITAEKLGLQVNTEKGVFDTTNDINTDKELIIGINNKYLLDALKTINREEIEIRFNRNINPLVISDNEGSEHLILPIKIAS